MTEEDFDRQMEDIFGSSEYQQSEDEFAKSNQEEYSNQPNDNIIAGEEDVEASTTINPNDAFKEPESPVKEHREEPLLKQERSETTPRRSGKRTPNKKTTAPSSDMAEKILEARRDFDEALERIKSTGNRRRRNPIEIVGGSEPVDLDDMALSFCRQMQRASEADTDAIESGRPAVEKQKMLPAVQAMLMRKHMYEVLLDNGILEAIRRWLEPLPNRQMPAPNIRKTLLELLKGVGRGRGR